MASNHLPKFKNPPVVETILGVQYEPLRDLSSAHLGVFWKELKELDEQWCSVNDASPLEPEFESFGEDERWGTPGFRLKLSQEINFRLQIRNKDASRMIQVQNGRLHYNWLGHGGGDYPSYETVRPEFVDILDKFREFILSESNKEFKPNQWELTYVNHLPKGSVWNEPGDWRRLFPGSPSLTSEGLPVRLESFGGEWHYEIEPQRGRLHVKLSHGQRAKADQEKEEILVMTLTARGPINKDGKTMDLGCGLDLGHETIVNAFKGLTSKEAHDEWGLKK